MFNAFKRSTPAFLDGKLHQRNICRDDSVRTLRDTVDKLMDEICSQSNPCATIQIVNIEQPLLAPHTSNLTTTSINIDGDNLTIKQNSFGPLYEPDGHRSIRSIISNFNDALEEQMRTMELSELNHDESEANITVVQHQAVSTIINF